MIVSLTRDDGAVIVLRDARFDAERRAAVGLTDAGHRAFVPLDAVRRQRLLADEHGPVRDATRDARSHSRGDRGRSSFDRQSKRHAQREHEVRG